MVTEIDISSFEYIENTPNGMFLEQIETEEGAREVFHLMLYMCVWHKPQYMSLNAAEEENLAYMDGGIRYSLMPLTDYYIKYILHFLSMIVHESTTKWVTPQRHYARFDIIRNDNRSCGYISEDPNAGNIDLIFFSHT